MRLPWSAETIFCADEQELANLLIWLRKQSLSYGGKVSWEVRAIIPGILDDEEAIILGYYVDVPWDYIKKRVNKLEPQQALSSILRPPY